MRPTLSHMWRICPGSGFFRAKRRRVSFCQLTLQGASGLPRKFRPWARRLRPWACSVPLTSTMNSCSSFLASSLSLRDTLQFWVNTCRPQASVSSGRHRVRRSKWRCRGRTAERSRALWLAFFSSCSACSGVCPAGLCSSRVIGSWGVRTASGCRATVSSATLKCGSSTIWPSTLTQPPSMYSSASRREQPTSSARRLDRRIGSVMVVAATKRGAV